MVEKNNMLKVFISSTSHLKSVKYTNSIKYNGCRSRIKIFLNLFLLLVKVFFFLFSRFFIEDFTDFSK